MNIHNRHHCYRYFRTFLNDLMVVLAVAVFAVCLPGAISCPHVDKDAPASTQQVHSIAVSSTPMPEREISSSVVKPVVESGSSVKPAEVVKKPLPKTKPVASMTPPAEPTPAKHMVSLPPFHHIVMEVADRYAIDPFLIQAIIFTESSFNPDAKSKRGAGGLMQLMPRTAKELGVRDVYDPEQNIEGGVRYFRHLLDRFDGDIQLALAAYNAGPRHVRNYEGIPPFKATQQYVKKVLECHEKFKTESASAGIVDSDLADRV